MHTPSPAFPPLLAVGVTVLAALYAGKVANRGRLPSLIGFMIVGVVAGPSVAHILTEPFQRRLSFITEIALAFVAISIGLELSFPSLKKLGRSIIIIIFAESFGAFLLVTGALYLLTRDLPLSLIFGSIAPASAPAGTVAVIREYRARGPLTKALYAVVGFDDGLGIIIFGFAAAIARSLLVRETGVQAESLGAMLARPAIEVAGGIALGTVIALVFCFMARKLKDDRDVFILLFAFALVCNGICAALHFSVILTNMLVGLVIVNTQPHGLILKLHEQLSNVMPLLFVLFFALAGANLHVASLPALGFLGVVYILGRSGGLVGGAWLGAVIGKADEEIRKYLGLGILSQAGVAIGLSLIVKHEFAGIGSLVESCATGHTTTGDVLGTTVITSITATCIFFEVIGPILTKIGLTRAGEIDQDAR